MYVGSVKPAVLYNNRYPSHHRFIIYENVPPFASTINLNEHLNLNIWSNFNESNIYLFPWNGDLVEHNIKLPMENSKCFCQCYPMASSRFAWPIHAYNVNGFINLLKYVYAKVATLNDHLSSMRASKSVIEPIESEISLICGNSLSSKWLMWISAMQRWAFHFKSKTNNCNNSYGIFRTVFPTMMFVVATTNQKYRYIFHLFTNWLSCFSNIWTVLILARFTKSINELISSALEAVSVTKVNYTK